MAAATSCWARASSSAASRGASASCEQQRNTPTEAAAAPASAMLPLGVWRLHHQPGPARPPARASGIAPRELRTVHCTCSPLSSRLELLRNFRNRSTEMSCPFLMAPYRVDAGISAKVVMTAMEQHNGRLQLVARERR